MEPSRPETLEKGPGCSGRVQDRLRPWEKMDPALDPGWQQLSWGLLTQPGLCPAREGQDSARQSGQELRAGGAEAGDERALSD